MDIYLVSAEEEQPGLSLTEFILQRFPEEGHNLQVFNSINTKEKVVQVIEKAQKNNAFLAFTILDRELKEELVARAREARIPTIDLLSPYLKELSVLLHFPFPAGIWEQKLDKNYFRRIDAIEFAVRCDDGRDLGSLKEADMVLIGVSRTSKTPLSIYLAHQGYRTGNVPLIPEISPPRELFLLPRDRVIGLTIQPEALKGIRQERLRVMGIPPQGDYASLLRIEKELVFAEEIMRKLGCYKVDVTNRSLEELSVLILRAKGDL